MKITNNTVMNVASKYRVKYYVGTLFSILTRADHYSECDFVSEKDLPQFASQISKTGFQHPNDPGLWIMPGAILEIREITK
ncbi:MAG: hypothetical protein HMLKMBBP_01532 [Planctomycetes bacterium]|nr:hypothetical protein [Planctomycetota bacterium]